MTRHGRRFEDAVRDRLDDYLDARDLAAVWFARPANFAWVTGGDNDVDTESEYGEAAVGYDGTELTVVTNNIEDVRLDAEQLPEAPTVQTYPWHRDSLPQAVANASQRPAAADILIDGFGDRRADGSRLRQPLNEMQARRYRGLVEEHVETTVALVGGARRTQKCRHYVPSDAAISERMMRVVA